MVANAECVKSLYEAFGRGDVPAVLGAFDPQIQWQEAVHYTLTSAGLSTHLRIDIDVTPELEDYMTRVWPTALARLKQLCEERTA